MIEVAGWRSWDRALVCAALGAWAAAIAVAPNAAMALLLAAPLAAIPLCWWLVLSPDRWLTLFLCAVLLLPPLPFALGDSGPHPAVLPAAFGLFAGVLRLPEWRVRSGFLTRTLLVFFLLLVASAAVAALNSGPTLGAATLARVLLFGISLYVFLYAAYGPGTGARPALKAIYWAAVLSALFACVDFYLQLPPPAGFARQFVWLDTGMYRRAQGVFYEASTLGNLCAFFLVMIAVALLRPRREAPVSRPALVAGGVVFAAALVLSYSRASLVNVFAALAALAWLHRRRLRLRRVALVFLLAASTAALLAYFVPAFAGMYWGRLRGTAHFLFPETGAVLSGRLETWRGLGRFLLDHPWAALVGVGYKTLPYSSVAGHPVIADNMYLSMLVETGVTGLAAMLLFHAAILTAAWRAARRASFYGVWIFCFWVGQLFQMFSGDLLTYWRVLPVYFWVLALAVRESP